MDIDVISLEDNKKYFIVDTIIDEDNKFVVKLDSSIEFEEVMALFNAKYREE